MLRVRLLGAVAVERDGEPMPVPGSARRLLAFLALRRGADASNYGWNELHDAYAEKLAIPLPDGPTSR